MTREQFESTRFYKNMILIYEGREVTLRGVDFFSTTIFISDDLMTRECDYSLLEFKEQPTISKYSVIPSDEELATELIARYNSNSRGNPIAKKAFVDAILWLKNRKNNITLLLEEKDKKITELKEEKQGILNAIANADKLYKGIRINGDYSIDDYEAILRECREFLLLFDKSLRLIKPFGLEELLNKLKDI